MTDSMASETDKADTKTPIPEISTIDALAFWAGCLVLVLGVIAGLIWLVAGGIAWLADAHLLAPLGLWALGAAVIYVVLGLFGVPVRWKLFFGIFGPAAIAFLVLGITFRAVTRTRIF